MISQTRLLHSCKITRLVTTLFAARMVVTSGHVVLVEPTPRSDNDYLFSFDEGVCNPGINSCNAFCGDPYSEEENPVTVLPVGVPITIRWKTNIAHDPYFYRISLNPQAKDNNFDNPDNILTTISNEDAAEPGNVGLTGAFSATVTIPVARMDSCYSTPCVLQLFDLYYFVSCANVLLKEAIEQGPSSSPDRKFDDVVPPPAPSSSQSVPTLPPSSVSTETTVVSGTSSNISAAISIGGGLSGLLLGLPVILL